MNRNKEPSRHGKIKYGKMNYGKMSCGKMSCGEMNYGKMSCGEMNCGEMNCGEMNCGEMSCGEMNCGKMSCGEMNRGEMNRGEMIARQATLFTKAGMELTSRLRKRAFGAIMRQEIGYFDEADNNSGVLCARLASDASKVQGCTGGKLGLVMKNLASLG